MLCFATQVKFQFLIPSKWMTTPICALSRCATVFLLMFLFVPAAESATKGPTTWWPDPTSGLMWTGTDNGPGIDYQQAVDFCQNLQLGGFSGWRLPTIDEIEHATTYVQPGPATVLTHPKGTPPANRVPEEVPAGPESLFFKWTNTGLGWTWSSSAAGSGTVYTEGIGLSGWFMKHRRVSKPEDHVRHHAFCVRLMESDLLQTAKDANVSQAVADTKALQGWILIRKSETAIKSLQYQDAVTAAKQAVLVIPKEAQAFRDLGVAEGDLGQWDDAIASLTTAHKLNSKDDEIISNLAWAKNGKKQARK
jgi:tetratricopeptide (TPR) repeat protein